MDQAERFAIASSFIDPHLQSSPSELATVQALTASPIEDETRQEASAAEDFDRRSDSPGRISTRSRFAEPESPSLRIRVF